MLKLYVLLAAYQTAFCATLSPTKKIAHSSITRSALYFGTMTHGVKKENLPSKMCVTCNRPFTWRKKWERCWDEVSTCSKGCNAKRRALAKANGHSFSDDEEEEGEEINVKTAGTKEKLPMKADTIVKNVATRVELVRAHLDDDDSDDNEDGTVIAEDILKSGKKLSRKKMQKLKMMQIPTEVPTEENYSRKVSDEDDVASDEDEAAEDEAEDEDEAEEEDERTENAKNDKKLSKKLQRLNMNLKHFPVEMSTTNTNLMREIGTDDDNDEADEEEINNANEPVKSEKKLSRKKLQKLKLKETLGEAPIKDGPTERTKACAVCKENMTLLFRCQWDASKQWRFVCTFIEIIMNAK